MPVTTRKHDGHGKGLEGLNRLLDPRNIPGYVDASRLATEGQDRLLKSMALLAMEPIENLDRIHGLVKVLKALKNTGLVDCSIDDDACMAKCREI